MYLETFYGVVPNLVKTTEIVDTILSVNLVPYHFKIEFL